MPPASVIPVTWSPSPLRIGGGSAPAGTTDEASVERAQNAPTS